jgi:hypothetical protein
VFRRIVALLALVILEASELLSTKSSSAVSTDERVDDHEQRLEDIWTVEVIERSSDRTIGDIADINSMATGLLAVQAAIYAILIDRRDDFAHVVTTIFVLAIVAAAINLSCFGRATCRTRKVSTRMRGVTRAWLAVTLLQRSAIRADATSRYAFGSGSYSGFRMG